MNMTQLLPGIAAIVIAYLLGSFPAAYLMGKIRKGVDIRQIGSHNMGTMNTIYQVGFWPGILVLAIDIGKGALAVYISQLLTGNNIVFSLICGAVVVLGHAFPVFLKFKGGKGGATCIGVLARLLPLGTLIYLGVFLLLLAITRFATLSYAISFIVFPVGRVALLPRSGSDHLFDSYSDYPRIPVHSPGQGNVCQRRHVETGLYAQKPQG